MTTISDGPRWLEYVPENRLNELFKDGSKAILLFGPPRTGKTRAVDKLLKRDDPNRRTIQIHSGWGYDELVISLRPKSSGEWEYVEGPLLQAIKSKATVIVLEEINRTEFSQAIGEILSLLEATYRGEENKITLRNGEEFFIPKETVFICTMNTVDRSTEELDDALIGRFDAVEFKPRVESLSEMLSAASFDESKAEKTRILFAYIQQYYPLGHGYFADYKPDRDLTKYYLSKIRPVLQKHFKGYRDDELSLIDKKVEELRV
jgi:hypothetical protein